MQTDAELEVQVRAACEQLVRDGLAEWTTPEKKVVKLTAKGWAKVKEAQGEH